MPGEFQRRLEGPNVQGPSQNITEDKYETDVLRRLLSRQRCEHSGRFALLALQGEPEKINSALLFIYKKEGALHQNLLFREEIEQLLCDYYRALPHRLLDDGRRTIGRCNKLFNAFRIFIDHAEKSWQIDDGTGRRGSFPPCADGDDEAGVHEPRGQKRHHD